MTQDEKREWLLSQTEWQIWGLAIKKGWTKEQRDRIINWHRSKQTDYDKARRILGGFKDG